MSTRLIFNPDAAAHSAKNAHAAPGSAVQPQDRTREIPMVETHAAARETERHGDETTYAYTPHELNQMLSREVAGRLRELADTLDANAAFLFASTAVPAAFARPRLRAYLDVSSQLRAVARHEIETANVRVVTR